MTGTEQDRLTKPEDDEATCTCPPDDTGSAIEYETCEACMLPYARAPRDDERCAHWRRAVDACLGCGRRFERGELVGSFLVDLGTVSCG